MLTIGELNYYVEKKWWESDIYFKLDLPTYSYDEKKRNENNLENIIEWFINHINKFPESKMERAMWKDSFYIKLDEFIINNEAFKLGVLDKEMKEDFIESTKMFIKFCKDYDEELNLAEIGQALRNVWIVNIFQKIIGEKIKISDSIFAYSMLYPYTDNFIDDFKVEMQVKKKFNMRLKSRLLGNDVVPENKKEKKVYDMISLIEKQYEREEYDGVYKSLLAIESAQEKSLNQQEAKSIPYERNILGISVEKGGTSVLVDGYLINGKLNEDEERFAYSYGFLLQLCDDLQDVETDLSNNHITIMSQIANKYKLDCIVNKLINFTEECINESNCFKDKNEKYIKKLIKENCILMMLVSAVKGEAYFTSEYIATLDKYLPVSKSYIKNLNKIIKKKGKKLKSNYYGIKTEDVITFLLT